MDAVNEFPKFLERLYAAFPDLLEWVKQNSPDIAMTQGAWAETLKPCTLDECRKVLSDWINAIHPPPKAYERSHVALMIRQSVMQDRDKARRENAPHKNVVDDLPQRTGSNKNIPSIAHALARCLELKRSGTRESIIELELKRMLPPTTDHFNEPRYRCHQCLDRGTVCIWSPSDIDAIRDGRISRGGIVHQAAAACTCAAGDRIYNARSSAASKGKLVARFDKDRHCLWTSDPFAFVEQQSAGKAWVG